MEIFRAKSKLLQKFRHLVALEMAYELIVGLFEIKH